jgi:hypothetical protein
MLQKNSRSSVGLNATPRMAKRRVSTVEPDAPFCELPPHFFARALSLEESRIERPEQANEPAESDADGHAHSGTVLSVECWDGRVVLEISSI